MKPTLCLGLALALGTSHAAAPEIARPPAPPQAAGTLHTLRHVPEACTRLQGRFEAGGGYAVTLKGRPGCTPRADFDPAVGAAAPVGEGWILNDVLRVPRADRPGCEATVQVWRHPGALAQIAPDGQRRVRMYLNAEQSPAAQRPRFAASLATTPACAGG